MVADCLPVLFTNEDGSLVAAAHAGWRGLAGAGAPAGERAGKGVLESVYESFSALAQVIRAPAAMKIIAWLGPCIGPSAFEVGAEVKSAFELSQPEASRFFEPTGSEKYLADLAGLARLRLNALGVSDVYGNDGSPAWCTVGNPSRFFSHRRDAGIAGNGFGTTGRMAAAIWRV
jgi:polyphenol oxidase